MSLEETKTSLISASKTAELLLIQINRLYIKEIRSDEKYLGEALSELHNQGIINLVELVTIVDKTTHEYDFFSILYAFENALPLLESSVEDVLYCLVHLTEKAGRDLAVGGIYRAFQSFCCLKSNRPSDSIKAILNPNNIDAYAPFLSNSLLAFDSKNLIDAIHITESLITHENKTVRRQVYFALGNFNVTRAQTDLVWEIFSTNARNERDSDCCASLLRGVLNFGEKLPTYWPLIEELLILFLNSSPPEVQYEISNIVAFQRKELPEGIVNILINQLMNVSPEHTGIINNIDHLLVKLVEQNSSSLAIKLLESILAEGVDFNSLNYFSSELLSKHQKLLNQIITRWFLGGESSLCIGVMNLFDGLTGKDIELKADMLLLQDDNKQIFACHKAVGWLFNKPTAAASFILSIYELANIASQKQLEEILYHPLLLSYPLDLKKYFELCIEKENQAKLCERLLIKIEKHHENLGKISNLKELRAPLENINIYRNDFHRKMQKAQDEAPSSIFRDLCTVQNLLYGNSSIYYIEQGDGIKVRQEMEMQSFSHSSEIPRLDVVDPGTLDYMLRVYRHERTK
jgi:hypothetical protein